MKTTYFIQQSVHRLILTLVFFQNFAHAGTAVDELPIDFVVSNKLKAAYFEIANTYKQRQIGLMRRTTLNENSGMIFVYGDTEIRCFWMKHTQIPISVGFVDEHGILIQVADMQPLSTEKHCSSSPIKYAIEMNRGWFESHNIRVGDVLIRTIS
ncbi:MAG: DUF192 domain-containing protein [Burkholderiales bacterium]|nr:DUF192 domain-containing protein [Burkholderiales bacterium]